MNRLTTILCLAACFSANSATAQPAPLYPRVELSVGLTGMSRGPGEGSEQALASTRIPFSHRMLGIGFGIEF